MKLYADENVDDAFVKHLRERFKVNIVSARDLGYAGRDDQFQFQEAKRQGRFLLTNDRHFMDHSEFPFHKSVGVVVLDYPKESIGAAWLSLWLTEELIPSGGNLEGTLVVVHEASVRIHSVSDDGHLMHQDLDLRRRRQS